MSVIGNGIYLGGVNTSDATATAADILSGKTAYVNGSKITGSITVYAPSPYVPPITLISFSINNVSYQAENGMTWAEWCESEYNTGGWYISNTEVTDGRYSVSRVYSYSIIEAGRSYDAAR